jgi:hypothetical protein
MGKYTPNSDDVELHSGEQYDAVKAVRALIELITTRIDAAASKLDDLIKEPEYVSIDKMSLLAYELYRLSKEVNDVSTAPFFCTNNTSEESWSGKSSEFYGLAKIAKLLQELKTISADVKRMAWNGKSDEVSAKLADLSGLLFELSAGLSWIAGERLATRERIEKRNMLVRAYGEQLEVWCGMLAKEDELEGARMTIKEKGRRYNGRKNPKDTIRRERTTSEKSNGRSGMFISLAQRIKTATTSGNTTAVAIDNLVKEVRLVRNMGLLRAGESKILTAMLNRLRLSKCEHRTNENIVTCDGGTLIEEPLGNKERPFRFPPGFGAGRNGSNGIRASKDGLKSNGTAIQPDHKHKVRVPQIGLGPVIAHLGMIGGSVPRVKIRNS